MRFGTMTAIAVAAVLTPGAVAAQDAEAIAAMRAQNDRIQFASYPRDALRRGEEGVVGIAVTTDKQGRLMSCAVSKSSGFRSLDEASCDFLLEHAKMRPYLAPNGGGIVKHQEGQVVWKLPPGTPRPAAVAMATQTATVGAKADDNKKICRAQTKTGSLIASQRICLTKREWYLQYLHAQEETQDMHPKFQPTN